VGIGGGGDGCVHPAITAVFLGVVALKRSIEKP
jgi:hypothetical protein